MKPYHRNPRQITKGRLNRLTDTLKRLGDLGGIVHNLETDEIIGGNQRMAVFADGAAKLVEQFEQPDEQGTVGLGYIVWQGKPYAYRQVRWDEATAAEANIVANIGAGQWDFEILANQWDTDWLQTIGFDDSLLKEWQQATFALGDMLAAEDGGIFNPNLSPGMSNGTISDEDIRKKVEELKNKFSKPGNDKVEVICPKCGEIFYINKDEVK